MLEIEQHLVRDDPLEAVLQARELAKIVDVEVADAGVADLSLGEELGEAVDRLAERHVAPPVQEVEVEAVRREASQAALARLAHPFARPVLRIELAHQEDLFAAARDRLADDPFGAAVGVHLGGVDERHAEIEPGPERGDLTPPVRAVLAHAVGALAEDRHGLAAGKPRRGHRLHPTGRASRSGAAATRYRCE